MFFENANELVEAQTVGSKVPACNYKRLIDGIKLEASAESLLLVSEYVLQWLPKDSEFKLNATEEFHGAVMQYLTITRENVWDVLAKIHNSPKVFINLYINKDSFEAWYKAAI